MAATKFGPGTLQIGETGTAIDASCLVNSLTITSDVSSDDDVTKLCGTVQPGARTYTFTMEGNLDLDTDQGAAGLFALSQLSKGTQVAFTFTPNTEDGTEAAGFLIIDPMDFGADEFGKYMASDISWELVGEPTYTWGDGVAADGVTGQSSGPAHNGSEDAAA